METLTRTCSVPKCNRSPVIKGFCRMDYKRWKRNGTAERATVDGRFFSHVKAAAEWDDCWIWTSSGSDGYGRFRLDGRDAFAHRWAYEYFRTEIPEGLALDHLCRNRGCVNPWHLEPVTWRENILRGEGIAALNAQKTHCKNGHAFTDLNTYYRPDRPGCRECRACREAAHQRAKSR